jgi:hypothetical protein
VFFIDSLRAENASAIDHTLSDQDEETMLRQPVKIPTPRSGRLRPSTATRRSVSRSSRRWRP